MLESYVNICISEEKTELYTVNSQRKSIEEYDFHVHVKKKKISTHIAPDPSPYWEVVCRDVKTLCPHSIPGGRCS